MVRKLLGWLTLRPKRWRHLRHVPLHQMATLLLAVFLLFSVLGFYNDLMSGGTEPYLIAIVSAVLSGAIATAWLLAITRMPIYGLFLLAGVQTWSLFSHFSAWLRKTFHPQDVSAPAGIHFSAIGIVVCVMLSYSLFVRYIRKIGNETLRYKTELELAHAIQKTLVPVISQRTPRFEIYGISQPSEKVGGDLVDALTLANGDTVAYVADVAGHGLPAGILMGMLKTATRTALRDQGAGEGAATLSMLMERLDLVLPEVKEAHMYATFTALRLNADGRCFYGSAASPPVLHWHALEKTIERIEEEQFPLGLLPIGVFPARELLLFPGDILLIATDGIIEVCSKKQLEFGIDALESLLSAQAEQQLPQIAASVLAAIARYGKQQDDQTLLLVRRLAD
jgi:serine phosphatase RsbU (regulator of sigma subunit)